MVFSVKKYRFYFLLSKVVFFVDHMAFRYLVNKFDLSGHIARWILFLQEFDYEVVYKPGGCIFKRIICRTRISEEKDTGRGIDDNFSDAARFAVSTVPNPKLYNHVADFLTSQSILENLSKIERRKVRIQGRHFIFISGKFYQR